MGNDEIPLNKGKRSRNKQVDEDEDRKGAGYNGRATLHFD